MVQDLEERLQMVSHKAYEAEARAETASQALTSVRSRCQPLRWHTLSRVVSWVPFFQLMHLEVVCRAAVLHAAWCHMGHCSPAVGQALTVGLGAWQLT